MSSQAKRALIQGLTIDEWAEVKTADVGLRNLYGGVVRLEVHWGEGSAHSMSALDLDQAGAEELAHALLEFVKASASDYEEAQG